MDIIAMASYVFSFQDIDIKSSSVHGRWIAGGKGINLLELRCIEGINVPDGFFISAEAYAGIIRESAYVNKLLNQLSFLGLKDRDEITRLSGEIRDSIESIAIPRAIIEEITGFINRFGVETAFAVRSSATAEDLPAASFAGQHDTYLNIVGTESITRHIRRCWASLFTERAVFYRLQNGYDHRKVQLSVIIQKMIFPEVSGILFTADPVTCNRKVVSIDASFGLGESIVSGRVNPDNYKVRNGRITRKKIASKKLAVHAAEDGGTNEIKIKPANQSRQALTDEQILKLEQTGRKIEKHFGSPQDIEWCLADNTFHIVQSRPITTLYPIPFSPQQDQTTATVTNGIENHVYVSVGHNQMMTDAMKPLGISFFNLTTPGSMSVAGGRLFVDISQQLASAESRKRLLQTFGQSDPLMKDAIMTLIKRKDFIRLSEGGTVRSAGYIEKVLPWSYLSGFENNPSIVAELINISQKSLDDLNLAIEAKSGTDLMDFIQEDISQLKKILFNPQSWEAIKIGLYAMSWINKKMLKWLGEKNAADLLSRSVPGNVTSEMGLALLEVADVIRPYPEIIDYLQNSRADNFPDELIRFKGGREAREAILFFLKKYGMRCSGEIDITRERWSEKPALIISMILNDIRNFENGASDIKLREGEQSSLLKEQELIARLLILPGGKAKARETKRMIALLRTFIGYREYPKYGMISRYFIYKRALLREAEKLVHAGVIPEKEDIYYLTFDELREAFWTNKVDYRVISERKDEFRLSEKMTPPRLITSDGEIISPVYNRNSLPAGAIAGLAVSSGVVEGRARIILNIEEADIKGGDILVTSFTDPGWAVLFVSIKGLVTEVGGLMTHGAVIAREYGLPAVVGVANATRLIKDGQLIRINGTEGYVQIL
jgi:rifampicin phosphotransferase